MSIARTVELSSRIDDLKHEANLIHFFTRYACLNWTLPLTCGDREQLHVDLNEQQRDELCAMLMRWEKAKLEERGELIRVYQDEEDGQRVNLVANS